MAFEFMKHEVMGSLQQLVWPVSLLMHGTACHVHVCEPRHAEQAAGQFADYVLMWCRQTFSPIYYCLLKTARQLLASSYLLSQGLLRTLQLSMCNCDQMTYTYISGCKVGL